MHIYCGIKATPSGFVATHEILVKYMFDYTLTFRNTKAHANADALSRLPLAAKPAEHFEPAELVLLTTHLENSPVSASQISEATTNIIRDCRLHCTALRQKI